VPVVRLERTEVVREERWVTTATGGRSLGRYVPRLAAEWELDAPQQRWRLVPGALCMIDISGFTRLSERLAAHGRIGAEELTGVLDRVFGTMLDLAYARGGALLKFGGDALLLHFGGDDAAMQAASSAVEMRSALRATASWRTSVGRMGLRMSVGVHTGPVHVFRGGRSHRELVVAGPNATAVTEMEKAAGAGEIVVT
jgi:class 3 adenylate cyclase